MSKQGVAKTQAHRKPRRRVKLEEREIDGAMVVGKECTKCGEWKPIKQFTKRNDRKGWQSRCKPCKAEITKNYEYDAEKRRTYLVNYYNNHREKQLEYIANWQKNNKEKVKIKYHRRRARIEALPDTLTDNEWNLTLSHFDNKCGVTGIQGKLELEHFLPTSIGHGGTTFGNCYPMTNGINQSKSDSNGFEWFEANRQRFELSQEKFDRLVDYLAVVNGLTSEEYREFYDWCFDNPRTVDEIKRDQRHSIEIWREASGKQFPLPAYTQTYYSTESEEVS